MHLYVKVDIYGKFKNIHGHKIDRDGKPEKDFLPNNVTKQHKTDFAQDKRVCSRSSLLI